MEESRPSLIEVAVKTVAVHTITYFAFGLLALLFVGYGSLYAETSLTLLMRQTNSPLVMAGPLFQPIRGLLFAIVFYLLRDVLFKKQRGWLIMWIVLVVVGVIDTFGPAPGSIEGFIYTIIPIGVQLKGLPEVVLQTLVLSAVLVYWVNHPATKWLSWIIGILFIIAMLLPVLGLLARQQS